MKITPINIWTILLISVTVICAEQFGDETFSDRARCVNNEEEDVSNREKNQNSGPYNLYQPRQRFDVYEKHPTNQLETSKRSLEATYDDSSSIHKRQVGVVYGNGKPIGILQVLTDKPFYHLTLKDLFQPYQESYKFIPVKEELNINGIDKREVPHAPGDYPSILADFKILQASKMPQLKREYKQIKPEATKDVDKMRILRSSSANAHQIEDKLKNILDDMGLVEEENHEKRNVEGENKAERQKREKVSSTTEDNSSSNPLKRDTGERQKREKDDTEKLAESFEDPTDSSLSGKAPLISKSAIETRESEGEDDSDYEKRMERQIKDKITALKEEVKRQIHELKNQDQEQEADEDTQRKKRQISNLVDLENDLVDPLKDGSEEQLKPLIRRRRTTRINENFNNNNSTNYQPLIRRKRNTPEMSIKQLRRNLKKLKRQQNLIFKRSPGINSDEQSSLFDEDSSLKKDSSSDYTERNRRSDILDDYYMEDDRSKRDEFPVIYDSLTDADREKRRVDDIQNVNRPQQLTDMSELDLFGALSKNYGGELSRIKRIKRNNDKI